MAFAASAAVSLFIWACQGYIRTWLFVLGLVLWAATMVALPLWMIRRRDMRPILTLIDWFARLAAGTPIIAAVLAVLGQFNCAAGALIASGLFGAVLSVLTMGHRRRERRRAGRQIRRALR
jgi:hypothetical protein